MSMVSSLRGQLTPREGAGPLPALLLDQGQLPILLSSYHWLCWDKGKPAAEGGRARPMDLSTTEVARLLNGGGVTKESPKERAPPPQIAIGVEL